MGNNFSVTHPLPIYRFTDLSNRGLVRGANWIRPSRQRGLVFPSGDLAHFSDVFPQSSLTHSWFGVSPPFPSCLSCPPPPPSRQSLILSYWPLRVRSVRSFLIVLEFRTWTDGRRDLLDATREQVIYLEETSTWFPPPLPLLPSPTRAPCSKARE